NKYKVLHRSQYGFRKNHSCNTAMINLIDKWLRSIDKGEIVGAIFFDLRKAFDIVDHDLLLQKLSAYHFHSSSLSWIRSYLTDRKQCISEKDISSSQQRAKSGVPQGSVLGPVMFLIFINDMPLFINGAFVDMYADDTTLHTASKDYQTVETNLQVSATGFKTWCGSNKMYINIQKTSSMEIGTRQNLSHSDTIKLYLDNEVIKEVDNQKLLGMIIDKNLSWEKQIDSVCLNITRRITLLKLLSKYVDTANLNQYYNSYILPIFDYGCIIWGRCSNSNMNRLLKLQKRAARIILQAEFMTPSQTMFKKLKWLPFPNRIQYHICVMVYKSLNDLAPDYLTELFTKTFETHGRNLRSVENDMLRVPCSRTCYYEKSFAVDGAKQWNSLPLHLRQSSNLNIFKKALKSHLLNV
ncbi:MAG: reverse transcriptase family protein, partial [gamma proteobacterium symbiont of Lucinoma myriamae]|nr:reverse transcriptase family protein [gamma proteobacterium symbiont of Lucinoma myriamae]